MVLLLLTGDRRPKQKSEHQRFSSWSLTLPVEQTAFRLG